MGNPTEKSSQQVERDLALVDALREPTRTFLLFSLPFLRLTAEILDILSFRKPLLSVLLFALTFFSWYSDQVLFAVMSQLMFLILRFRSFSATDSNVDLESVTEKIREVVFRSFVADKTLRIKDPSSLWFDLGSVLFQFNNSLMKAFAAALFIACLPRGISSFLFLLSVSSCFLWKDLIATFINQFVEKLFCIKVEEAEGEDSADESDEEEAALHFREPNAKRFTILNRSIERPVQNNELHNPSFQSVLKKKGEVVKKWQRRLFLLKDGKLFYFKPQGNNFVATPSLCQGVIVLAGCQPAEPYQLKSEPYTKNCFILKNKAAKGRSFKLVAESEQVMQSWIRHINRSREIKGRTIPLVWAASSPSNSSDSSSPMTSLPASPILSSSSSSSSPSPSPSPSSIRFNIIEDYTTQQPLLTSSSYSSHIDSIEPTDPKSALRSPVLETRDSDEKQPQPYQIDRTTKILDSIITKAFDRNRDKLLSQSFSDLKNIIISGPLKKKGLINTQFKTRLFVLTQEKILYYFAKKTDKKAKGCIQIERASVINRTSSIFITDIKQRVYQIVAENPESHSTWFYHLKNASQETVAPSPPSDDVLEEEPLSPGDNVEEKITEERSEKDETSSTPSDQLSDSSDQNTEESESDEEKKEEDHFALDGIKATSDE